MLSRAPVHVERQKLYTWTPDRIKYNTQQNLTDYPGRNGTNQALIKKRIQWEGGGPTRFKLQNVVKQ